MVDNKAFSSCETLGFSFGILLSIILALSEILSLSLVGTAGVNVDPDAEEADLQGIGSTYSMLVAAVVLALAVVSDTARSKLSTSHLLFLHRRCIKIWLDTDTLS